MSRKQLITAATLLIALTACNGSAPQTGPAAADRNAPAPAAPAAGTGNAVTGNGLWGVTEEEDEASHRGIDFIAFNRSGRTVTALSLRPDEGPPDGPAGGPDAPWSANALTQAELPDGTRAAVHFEADIELCRWQLRATFDDRRTRAYPTVNLCETIRVDLR